MRTLIVVLVIVLVIVPLALLGVLFSNGLIHF
jgi:hypothetical protein